MTTAISVAGLHKSFGRTRAPNGLNLEVAAGELFLRHYGGQPAPGTEARV